jgi:hypothetical protein
MFKIFKLMAVRVYALLLYEYLELWIMQSVPEKL